MFFCFAHPFSQLPPYQICNASKSGILPRISSTSSGLVASSSIRCDRCDFFGLAIGPIFRYITLLALKKTNLIEMIFCYGHKISINIFWLGKFRECRRLRILMGSCPNIDPMIGRCILVIKHGRKIRM